jgi:hypothetical protein
MAIIATYESRGEEASCKGELKTLAARLVTWARAPARNLEGGLRGARPTDSRPNAMEKGEAEAQGDVRMSLADDEPNPEGEKGETEWAEGGPPHDLYDSDEGSEMDIQMEVRVAAGQVSEGDAPDMAAPPGRTPERHGEGEGLSRRPPPNTQADTIWQCPDDTCTKEFTSVNALAKHAEECHERRIEWKEGDRARALAQKLFTKDDSGVTVASLATQRMERISGGSGGTPEMMRAALEERSILGTAPMSRQPILLEGISMKKGESFGRAMEDLKESRIIQGSRQEGEEPVHSTLPSSRSELTQLVIEMFTTKSNPSAVLDLQEAILSVYNTVAGGVNAQWIVGSDQDKELWLKEAREVLKLKEGDMIVEGVQLRDPEDSTEKDRLWNIVQALGEESGLKGKAIAEAADHNYTEWLRRGGATPGGTNIGQIDGTKRSKWWGRAGRHGMSAAELCEAKKGVATLNWQGKERGQNATEYVLEMLTTYTGSPNDQVTFKSASSSLFEATRRIIDRSGMELGSEERFTLHVVNRAGTPERQGEYWVLKGFKEGVAQAKLDSTAEMRGTNGLSAEWDTAANWTKLLDQIGAPPVPQSGTISRYARGGEEALHVTAEGSPVVRLGRTQFGTETVDRARWEFSKNPEGSAELIAKSKPWKGMTTPEMKRAATAARSNTEFSTMRQDIQAGKIRRHAAPRGG